MKMILFGRHGQVAWALQRALRPLGDLTVFGSDEADFNRPEQLAPLLRATRPDVVVNAAAYTAVDRAESEPERAASINAVAPGVLAAEVAALDAWLVHYSTDYVFEGSGNLPQDEQTSTGPLSVYGRTKLAGEQRIQASGCRHLIFRTSWVYSARGESFPRKLMRRAMEQATLDVVDDQIGAPTGADLIADITAHALLAAQARPALSGLYHLAAAGETSWCGFARFIVDWAHANGYPVRATQVSPVSTSAWPTPARRPLNSRLDTQKLRDAFGLSLPCWQDGAARMLSEALLADGTRLLSP